MSFRIAEKQAKNSTFHRYKLGAVITKGNRVLSTGYNEIRYNRFINKGTIHAEEAAIVKLLKENRLDDLARSELYVTRISKCGDAVCSRPCCRCYNLIRVVGITRIHFIDERGRPVSESVN